MDRRAVRPHVFALFDQNQNPADIVVEHQLDPYRVAELYVLWVRLRRTIVTPPGVLDAFVRDMAELLGLPECSIRSYADLRYWLAGAARQLKGLHDLAVHGVKVDRPLPN